MHLTSVKKGSIVTIWENMLLKYPIKTSQRVIGKDFLTCCDARPPEIIAKTPNRCYFPFSVGAQFSSPTKSFIVISSKSARYYFLPLLGAHTFTQSAFPLKSEMLWSVSKLFFLPLVKSNIDSKAFASPWCLKKVIVMKSRAAPLTPLPAQLASSPTCC